MSWASIFRSSPLRTRWSLWASSPPSWNAEDSAVARQLALSGLMAGLSTAGQLVDRIDALDKGNRRRLLDAARQLAGLEPIETVDVRRTVAAASSAARVKMAGNPGPLRLAFSPSGGIVDLDEQEVEAARAGVEEESRQRVLEQQRADRAVEADALRQSEDARAAATRRLLPPGVPG